MLYFLLLNHQFLALDSSYLTFMTSSKELTLQVFKVTKTFQLNGHTLGSHPLTQKEELRAIPK